MTDFSAHSPPLIVPDGPCWPICVDSDSAREIFRAAMSGAELARGELPMIRELRERAREPRAPPPPDL
eukprot:7858554-Pyramimonas_sp.AAC.1